MKKIIIVVLFLILATISSCKKEEDILLFEKQNDTYIVSGLKDAKKITIPSTYKGLPVVEIKDDAFLNYHIEEIDLPVSLQRIGNHAFNYDHTLIIHFDGTSSDFEKIKKGMDWRTDNMKINYRNVNDSFHNKIKLEFNNHTFYATLVDNSSTKALVEKLKESPLVIKMEDYGNFEKVGNLGFSLPRNDESITTTYGDLILYLGSSITIYYDTNTWNFTRLGRIDNVTQKELKDALGSGNVTVTISLA